MRDPRSADSQAVGTHSIEPWLAVNGTYDTVLDKPETYGASVHRSVVLNGGLSAARDFHRTYFVFGYAGSGTDYLGSSAGIREGWTSSNVVTLAISSQVTQRVTLDFSEAGGAANGGFGAAAAGLQSGGLGLLGSMGVSSSFLFGGGSSLGGASTGLNPLQNGLVDADYYQQMSYFSSTSGSAGFLLSQRTMLNIGGSGSFVRRAGRNFSDANIAAANATLSTQLSRRFSVFVGYSFDNVNFVQSIGSTYMQGGFAGFRTKLSAHDEVSLSVSDTYMDNKFASTQTLPPDIAALLGVSTITTVRSTSRAYLGGRFTFNHTFEHGGFDLNCNSMIAPGNDLILLARSEACTASLNRTLTSRLSVVGLGGIRRLNGMTQSGSRYDVVTGGMLFSYRIFRGISLTAGATYRDTQVKPSSQKLTGVSANAGLFWSPHEGVNLF